MISVFDAQEAREAILGGARVIDCEDPAGALGDISPQRVSLIARAVIGYKRDLEIQISTNIGENQMLFKRDDAGRAVQRFPNEIAGKAAQAALGVAAAMGTDVHPVNIVKIGLDGMPRDIAWETLREAITTLHDCPYFDRSQVVAVFFALDLKLWNERKSNPTVIRDLLLLREYVVDPNGDIDIEKLFGKDAPTMEAIWEKNKTNFELFDGGETYSGQKPKSRVRLTELVDPRSLGYEERCGEDYKMTFLYELADLTAEAGADGIMIDTRIHTKVARMCCLKDGTANEKPDPMSGLPLKGIYTIKEFGTYAQYCHEKGIEFWASGSIQPYQAQKVWHVDDGVVDAMAVRSGASAPPRTIHRPGERASVIDNRGSRKVYRDLVAVYAPPTV